MTEERATNPNRIELTSVETWNLKETADMLQRARASVQQIGQAWLSGVASVLESRGRTPDDMQKQWRLCMEDDGVFIETPPEASPEAPLDAPGTDEAPPE